ncbi:MAG: type II toxin-antitoxin system VapC family toxin [bacterium]|nr:type II toxin-antitoxin system VapC family toxin [bacterium]
MNILVDTHILIWTLFSPNKLGKKNQKILLDQDNNIYVSVISLWEISLKYSVGKLKIQGIKIEEIAKAVEQSGFEILNLSVDEALNFYMLPKLKNKDPFDRMLIWQSIKNDYYLMSKDSEMSDYQDYGIKLLI